MRMVLMNLSNRAAPVAESVRESESRPRRVPQQFTFADVGEVTPCRTELHYSLTLARKRSPFRSRVGVLFDACNAVFRVIEIDRSEPPRAGLANGIGAIVKLDGLTLFDQNLPPHADEHLCKSHTEAGFTCSL